MINQFHDYHKLGDYSRSTMLLKWFGVATLFMELFLFILFFITNIM